MKRPIPIVKLLRFPMIFGSFLLGAGVAFIFRRELLGDLEAEANELFKGNEKSAQMLEEYKKEHQRLMKNKLAATN